MGRRFSTRSASRIALGAPISSAAPVPAVMDDIQILKGAQHSPAIVTGVPVSNSNDVQNYAQNAPVNNNNNNNNSMQMQAPTPQQMAMHVIIHEPRTDWQSGLFECFNDIPVCLGVSFCTCCAYGMLVDMHKENKAEGAMPFGNFNACCTVSSLSSVQFFATILSDPFYGVMPLYGLSAVAGSIVYCTGCIVSWTAICAMTCCVTSRNRSSIRNKFNLKAEPSGCDDKMVHFCCWQCALCQECRELKARHAGSMGRRQFNREWSTRLEGA